MTYPAVAESDLPRLGIHRALSEAAYRAAPGLNISLLKHMALSPLHCRQEQTAPVASTPAQELGQAFHAALLEPEKFQAEFFRAPVADRRSNVGKAKWADAWAAHPGQTPLQAADYDWIDGACEALWKRPDVHALLGASTPGMNEVSVFWEWRVEDVPIRAKGRIDRLTQLTSAATIVDVKTCPLGRAAPAAFPREVARYHYQAQAAYYLDGLEILSPRKRGWLWLVVEKEPPFAHAIYEPLPEVLAMGRALYERWLARYVACAMKNDWPGYEAGVTPIDLPPWVYREVELEF
jgi:exodeoxyribonuclease VIII